MSQVLHETESNPVLSAAGLRVPASGILPELRCELLINPGEFLLVHSPSRTRSRLLVDALLGLSVVAGGVAFCGHDWSRIDPQHAYRLRTQVGRSSGPGDWIQTRSVLENLLLPLRHNTMIADDLLRAKASEAAMRFGLPGIPTQLPGDCLSGDLLRASLVRAFLGRPRLVVLEHPLDGDEEGVLPVLIEAIRDVRRRGGAVLWFTRHKAIVYDHSIPADHHLQIAGSQMRKLDIT